MLISWIILNHDVHIPHIHWNTFLITGTLCEEPPVTGSFPLKWGDVFFDVGLKKSVDKPSNCRWLETQSLKWRGSQDDCFGRHWRLWRQASSSPVTTRAVIPTTSPFLWWRSCNMMTSSNGNIFRVTGPLCGESTGHRWIPRTKASDAELWCFLWSASEKTVEWTIVRRVIWDAIAPIITSLWWHCSVRNIYELQPWNELCSRWVERLATRLCYHQIRHLTTTTLHGTSVYIHENERVLGSMSYTNLLSDYLTKQPHFLYSFITFQVALWTTTEITRTGSPINWCDKILLRPVTLQLRRLIDYISDYSFYGRHCFEEMLLSNMLFFNPSVCDQDDDKIVDDNI